MSFVKLKRINNIYYMYLVENHRVENKVKQKTLKYLGKFDIGKLLQETINYVMQRDGFKCRKCGINQNLEIDHIKPLLKGGDNSPQNLQVLCKRCNASKSNKID